MPNITEADLKKQIKAKQFSPVYLLCGSEQMYVRTYACKLEQAIAGNRIGDIGAAVQGYVEERGYSVVRQFVGHGVGTNLHEDPSVPNFGTAGRGPRLLPGMTIAIEPMVNQGVSDVEILSDGWTTVTKDRKLSAHFEHTVAITPDGPVILTLP